jgi:2-keto-4-pentenoate hydratase/2-oxohepta-3-ene-1,7-dioic acid hydratase in catechol pathway
MKLVTYQTPTGPTLGALHNDQVIDLAASQQMETGNRPFPATMLALLEAGDAALAMAQAAMDYALEHDTLQQPQDSVCLLPPVTRPCKFICLGRNSAAHAREGGA